MSQTSISKLKLPAVKEDVNYLKQRVQDVIFISYYRFVIIKNCNCLFRSWKGKSAATRAD